MHVNDMLTRMFNSGSAREHEPTVATPVMASKDTVGVGESSAGETVSFVATQELHIRLPYGASVNEHELRKRIANAGKQAMEQEAAKVIRELSAGSKKTSRKIDI